MCIRLHDMQQYVYYANATMYPSSIGFQAASRLMLNLHHVTMAPLKGSRGPLGVPGKWWVNGGYIQLDYMVYGIYCSILTSIIWSLVR